MANDAEEVDDLEESSPQDNQEQDDSTVSEDEQTQDQEEEEEISEEADEADEERLPPLHENPRFREVNEQKNYFKRDNERLRDELEALRKGREEETMVANMTEEQKAVHKLTTQYGMVTKKDLDDLKLQNAKLQEQMRFEKFLSSAPEASAMSDVIQSLAYTPKYQTKTYKQIWDELSGASKQKDRKVVKRTVKSGIKGKGSTTKQSGGTTWTREKIAKLSNEDFIKNEKSIMDAVNKGLVK